MPSSCQASGWKEAGNSCTTAAPSGRFPDELKSLVETGKANPPLTTSGSATGTEERVHENRSHRRCKHGKHTCAPPRRARPSRLDANSRGPDSLTALAAEIGATPFRSSTPPKPEISCFVAIPTKAVANLPRGLFAKGRGQRRRDRYRQLPSGAARWPHRCDRPGMLEQPWVAQQIGRPVVKAFNASLPAAFSRGACEGSRGGSLSRSPAIRRTPVAGVMRLVDDLGFDLSTAVVWTTPARSRNAGLLPGPEAAALRRALRRSRIAAGSRISRRTGGSHQERHRSADGRLSPSMRISSSRYRPACRAISAEAGLDRHEPDLAPLCALS